MQGKDLLKQFGKWLCKNHEVIVGYNKMEYVNLEWDSFMKYEPFQVFMLTDGLFSPNFTEKPKWLILFEREIRKEPRFTEILSYNELTSAYDTRHFEGVLGERALQILCKITKKGRDYYDQV